MARNKIKVGRIAGRVEHDQLAHLAPDIAGIAKAKTIGAGNELAVGIEEDHAAVGDRAGVGGVVGVVADVAVIGARGRSSGGDGGVVDGLERQAQRQRNGFMIADDIEIDIDEG